MLNPVAKLHAVAISMNGLDHTGSAPVDIQAGTWGNYSTGISLLHASRSLRIRIGGTTGILELGSLKLTRVADQAVLLHIAEPEQLQALDCSQDLVPLPGGSSARYFICGSEPELLLPETNLDSPFTLEIRMQLTEDLSALAAYLREKQRGHAVPASVHALRAELWAHQSERVALAADYRRIKTNEQSVRSALVRAEESLRTKAHEHEMLKAEVRRLKEQVFELERALVGLRKEKDELRQSYSWKITGPLRAALRLLRTGPFG